MRLWLIGISLLLLSSLAHAQQPTQTTDAPLTTKQILDQKGTLPKLIKNVEAEFSDEARQKHINGRCLISMIVDVKGNPQNIQIVRCTDQSFEKNSLHTVAQYRFKPATTQEGRPVAVTMNVRIDYNINNAKNPLTPIRYRLSSPPGITSAEPGSDGVYPLTKDATARIMLAFPDNAYGNLAFMAKDSGDTACDLVLTISAKGNPSDVQETHCVKPLLEEPAVKSILKSSYKPGTVNGNAVPMRASLHFEYDDGPYAQ